MEKGLSDGVICSGLTRSRCFGAFSSFIFVWFHFLHLHVPQIPVLSCLFSHTHLFLCSLPPSSTPLFLPHHGSYPTNSMDHMIPPPSYGGSANSKDSQSHFIPPQSSDRPIKRPKIINNKPNNGMPRPPKMSSDKPKKKKSLSPKMSGASGTLGEGKVKKKGKGGSSCHQCKSRRNFTALTYCTSNLDNKKKNCRKKFCEHCLKKFYKESPHSIPDKTNWRCPSCRKICCCAACRRRKMKDAGQIPLDDDDDDDDEHVKPLKKIKSSSNGSSSTHRPHGHVHSHKKSSHSDSKSHKSHKSHHEKHRTKRHMFFDTMIYTHGSSGSDSDSSDESTSDEDEYSPEAIRRHNEQLATLYAVSQTDRVNKFIGYIMERNDISNEQKVETIANLLRSSLTQS